MQMDEQNNLPETGEAADKPADRGAAPIPERDPVTGKRDRRDPKDLNAFENFYENFRNVPVKYVDRFIVLCIAAIFVVVALGILNR